MRTWFPTPIAKAPPEPPSPMTMETMGTSRPNIRRMLSAIAVHLHEIAKEQIDVIARIGAARMPRELDLLPGSQLGIGLVNQRDDLLFENGDLVAEIDAFLLGKLAQVDQLLLETDDGFFE